MDDLRVPLRDESLHYPAMFCWVACAVQIPIQLNRNLEPKERCAAAGWDGAIPVRGCTDTQHNLHLLVAWKLSARNLSLIKLRWDKASHGGLDDTLHCQPNASSSSLKMAGLTFAQWWNDRAGRQSLHTQVTPSTLHHRHLHDRTACSGICPGIPSDAFSPPWEIPLRHHQPEGAGDTALPWDAVGTKQPGGLSFRQWCLLLLLR